MTGFRGTDDSGRVVEPLAPVQLRAMLQQAATFVVVQRAGPGGGPSAQARRSDGERWRVEVRSGAPGHHLSSHAPNTDAAYDLLRSWCADDGWWQQAFSWEPVEHRPG